MPVARYFLFVGGLLLALLFALDAFAPPQMTLAGNAAPSVDKRGADPSRPEVAGT